MFNNKISKNVFIFLRRHSAGGVFPKAGAEIFAFALWQIYRCLPCGGMQPLFLSVIIFPADGKAAGLFIAGHPSQP